MMATEDFFAKLTAMNWVERRYLKEKAVSDGADNLWRSFCTEAKDSVDAYNNRYKREYPVLCDPQTAHMRVSRQLPQSRQLNVTPQETIEISFNQKGGTPTVAAHVSRPNFKGAHSANRSYSFSMDADDEGRTFLVQDGKEVSVEQAVRTVLENFLFAD